MNDQPTTQPAQDTESDDVEKLHDRPFNPWREPRAPKVQEIVDDVIRQVEGFEKYHKLRARRRKAKDQETFESAVTAVICDLMHHHLSGDHEGGVYVTRSHVLLGRKGRYRPPAYTKSLPDILDRMASRELDFIQQELGHEGFFGPAKRTTIRAGSRLIARVKTHDVTLDELAISKHCEVIVLKRSRDDFWDEGGQVDYEDTPQTNIFRKQLNTINDGLEGADLDFDPALLTDNVHVDLTNRRLQRIFTQGRFDSGGRLFGGFWQALPKRLRRGGVWIDGEQAIELDYGQMAPRILYGLAGVQPDFDDAYVIPGFESYRAGIKRVMNSMFFSSKPLSRMPRGVKKEFETRHRIGPVMEAIQSFHQPIRSMFFTGIGHEAQHQESQIMVDLLLALRDQGITALPIHDSVLVPASRIDNTRTMMLDVFKGHVGVEGKVKKEGD